MKTTFSTSSALLMLLLLALLAPLSEAAGKVPLVPFQKFDFEKDFKFLETKRLVAPYSGTISHDPVRMGHGAGRFEIRPGDFVSDGYRAEIKDRYYAAMGQEIWYGFSTYIPKNFPIEATNSCILTQWHDQVDAHLGEATRSPPLAHRYREGRLDVTLRYSAEQVQKENGPEIVVYSEPNFARGVWQDFVYQIKWSFLADGLVRAWKNGKLIIDYHGPVGYNDTVGPYLKMGVYCRDPIKEPHVIYHDQYARGTSYREVDPSGTVSYPCLKGTWPLPAISEHFEYLGIICKPGFF